MIDFAIYVYAVACVLMIFAARGRNRLGAAAFGFFALSVVATPVLAYALLMALPIPKEPSKKELRAKLGLD